MEEVKQPATTKLRSKAELDPVFRFSFPLGKVARIWILGMVEILRVCTNPPKKEIKVIALVNMIIRLIHLTVQNWRQFDRFEKHLDLPSSCVDDLKSMLEPES